MNAMNDLIPKLSRVMDSALAQTCQYLESEFDLAARANTPESGTIEALRLREMTVIIGIGGAINLFVAFSFEDRLIEHLYQRMVAGMTVEPNEVGMLKQAAAGEIVNIVMGHCATDLQDMDSDVIPITPPTVLNLVKTVPRLKNAVFHLRSLTTSSGAMDVYLIGPRELFADNLDYK